MSREAAFWGKQKLRASAGLWTCEIGAAFANFASIFSILICPMQKIKSDFALPKNKFEPKYQL